MKSLPVTTDSQKALTVRKLTKIVNALTLVLFVGLATFVASVYLYMNGIGASSDTNSPPLSVVAFSAAIICYLIYYVLLGLQAARLKKSPILWVGLSVLSSPLGPILACAWIRADTKKACKEILCPREEMNRIAEVGDHTCREGALRSSNPYRHPNTTEENSTFGDFWDRGYRVAEQHLQRASKSQ